MVEPLGAALKDESWQVREAGAWALERIGDNRGAGAAGTDSRTRTRLWERKSDEGEVPYCSLTATWRFIQVLHTL